MRYFPNLAATHELNVISRASDSVREDNYCVACTDGHHEHCGTQTWCECLDPRDGTEADTADDCKRCEMLQGGSL